MTTREDSIQSGLLQGRLPGMKEWRLYYLEVTPSHFHIYEGLDDLDPVGQHLRSLEIHSSDITGVESKGGKKEFRFYILRVDGRYIFKCTTNQDREQWIAQLQRVITKQTLEGMPDFTVPSPDTFSPDNLRQSPLAPKRIDSPKAPLSPPGRNSKTLPSTKRTKSVSGTKISSVLDTPLPRPPEKGYDSPRASIVSNDSGIGVSGGGEIHRPSMQKQGSSSMPSSADGQFARRAYGIGSSRSDGGKFGRNGIQVDDSPGQFSYEKCKWFWGCMSRSDCESRLRSEGKINNFAVRINASGHYVMSLWRTDGMHHHKILNHGNIFRFERAAVSAEGESLVDLLDTYMKTIKDKDIKPFGGALYDQYTYAWNPPDFDMLLLQERLKEQKKMREKAKTPPSQRKNQYTPVDLDGKGHTSTDSESSGDSTFAKRKTKVGPPPPPVKPSKQSNEPKESPLEKSTHLSPIHAHGPPSTPLDATSTQQDQPAAASNVKKSPKHPKRQAGGQALIAEMVMKRNQPKDTPPQTATKPKKGPVPVPKPRPSKSSSTPAMTSHATQVQPQTNTTSPAQQTTVTTPAPAEEAAYANWDFGGGNDQKQKTPPGPITSKPSSAAGKTSYQNWPASGSGGGDGGTSSSLLSTRTAESYQNVSPTSSSTQQPQPQVTVQQQPQDESESVYMNIQGPAVKASSRRAARQKQKQQQQQTMSSQSQLQPDTRQQHLNGHGQSSPRVSEYQNIGKGLRRK